MSSAPLLDLLADAYHHAHTRLIAPRYYVACSGGRDSMALAFACHQLYTSGVIDQLPTLIHINHHLQTPSNDWAAQVQAFGKQLCIPTIVCDVYPDNHEQAARNARYRAFFEVMADGDVLLMAHHANDQAETILMRLIHGAGVAGLSGIKAWQNKSNDSKTIHLLRPWLSIGRAQITHYCQQHQLAYIEDPTNHPTDQTANLRAILRSDILPRLAKLNPEVVSAICRSADHLSSAHTYLQDNIQAVLEQTRRCGCCHQTLKITALLAHHPSLHALVIQAFIQGEEILPCNSGMVTQVIQLIQRPDNSHHTTLLWQAYTHAWILVRYDDYLYRYRLDVWQALTGGFGFDMLSMQFVSQSPPYLSVGLSDVLDGSLDVTLDRLLSIEKIDKHTKICLPRRTLYGKKLYQTLRIPPWLRQHLWLIDTSHTSLLVSLGQVWQLGDH